MQQARTEYIATNTLIESMSNQMKKSNVIVLGVSIICSILTGIIAAWILMPKLSMFG